MASCAQLDTPHRLVKAKTHSSWANPAMDISRRPKQLGEVVEQLSDPPGDVAAVFTFEILDPPVDKAVSR
jgi:hypothetical protein